MIINIPINIDEDQFNKLVETDYERKIEDRIYKDVRKALEEKSRYYNRRMSDGILVMVEEQIDCILKAHKNEVIEAAADKLAERLARTKAAKEILEDNRRFEKAYDYQPLTDYNNMIKEVPNETEGSTEI